MQKAGNFGLRLVSGRNRGCDRNGSTSSDWEYTETTLPSDLRLENRRTCLEMAALELGEKKDFTSYDSIYNENMPEQNGNIPLGTATLIKRETKWGNDYAFRGRSKKNQSKNRSRNGPRRCDTG